ncbi:MAG: hypothetical protein U0232_21630 [Thermomicrobiales bacterium]
MGSVRTLCYTGAPLEPRSLLAELGLIGQEYTLIVATTAQERQRAELAPPHQLADDQPQLVFHKVLRHLMTEHPLTRAEERIALQRAIRRAAADPMLSRLLRQDVFAWRDALADLAEQGADFARGISEQWRNRLLNPGIGDVLAALQREYRAEQAAHGRRPFEDAARDFLDLTYRPTAHVIVEGFTFLTTLQRHFIDVCRARNAIVHLVYARNDAQGEGFAIMRRTYASYAVGATRAVQTSPAGSGSLATLQGVLFADAATPVPIADDRVVLAAFTHRHQEVAACIARVRALLEQGADPRDIAIVVRDVAAAQPLLEEEARLQQLPVTLSIPPRLLLLTPLGRFVLTLYEIRREGALRMGAEAFEAIVASGWLGALLQTTVDQFDAVKAQFFARCLSEADWRRTLGDLRTLRRALPTNSRHAAASVEERSIDLWERALQQVRTLCDRLFASGTHSIGGHVERLLDELSRLVPEQLFADERQIVERIRESLEQLRVQTSLPMSPDEFGDVLNSLVREYDRPADEEEPLPDIPGRVWVTTPEGIDGYTKRHVLFIGVDDRRVPRGYAEPWPFWEDRFEEHQDQERYLSLAVVRAAQESLYLSYAQLDQDRACGPSPYLQETAARLGLRIAPPPAPAALPAGAVGQRASLAQARRGAYSLAEIAHFSLCPFRYKMEGLDRRARQYRQRFQIRPLAQGRWLGLIMQHLAETGLWARGRDEVLAMLQDVRGATEEQARAAFPGLRDVEW